MASVQKQDYPVSHQDSLKVHMCYEQWKEQNTVLGLANQGSSITDFDAGACGVEKAKEYSSYLFFPFNGGSPIPWSDIQC